MDRSERDAMIVEGKSYEEICAEILTYEARSGHTRMSNQHSGDYQAFVRRKTEMESEVAERRHRESLRARYIGHWIAYLSMLVAAAAFAKSFGWFD